MKKALALAASDARQVVRDPMMLFMAGAPLLLVLLFSTVVPFGLKLLSAKTGWGVEAYYPFAACAVLLLIPGLPGTMAGFLMLDERDEGLLQVYGITPIARSGYFVYRLTIPVALMACYGCLTVLVAGGAADDGFVWPALACAVLMATMQGVITALFLAGFASNKVEGLALSKLAALPVLAPLMLLLPETWQAAGWAFPAYWVAKTMSLALSDESRALWYGLIGLAVHAGWCFLFFKHFSKKSG
ncbi:hypothetical protein [Paenibacillus thermotolerans]|uniref:hypothetical protein n=1 Tax=Paenibacillus thermotolerans TaxID=3027807 RepID=UPI0023675CDE|nr:MULTISPECIES: hypothetical protein [unclassified Paenibacillus]